MRIAKKVVSDTGNVYHIGEEMTEEEAREEYNRLRQVGWPAVSLEIIELQKEMMDK